MQWGDRVRRALVGSTARSGRGGISGLGALSALSALCGLSGCLDDELDPIGHFQTGGVLDSPSVPEGLDEEQSTETWRPSTEGRTALPELSSFIALQRDFESFTQWNRLALGAGPHVVPDESGPRHVYVNVLPSKGAQQFAVGTMIVKTVAAGQSPSTWQVHGMVKRGGDFNAKGAYGWEYFDMSLDEEGRPTLAWRGEEPPEGEHYRLTIIGSDGELTTVEQSCNDCHISSANDAVLTPGLDLERFQ